MKLRLTAALDKSGRIVLPKPLRDVLQLEPGVTLEIETSEDTITLRPVRGRAPLHKKLGVWVFRSGEPLTVEVVTETLQQLRDTRHKQLLHGNE